MAEELKEINILEHVLVPEHRLLEPEEIEKLLQALKIKIRDLPYILLSDPVIKVLNAKVGDVIEIIRTSQTAGTSKYYRYVVG